MTSIDIRVTAHTRHYRIETAINGEIQPRHIFGCRDGVLPILSFLTAAELEHHRIRTRGQSDTGSDEATITVSMPSGRVLTFKLASVQDAVSNLPEGVLSETTGSGRCDPVDGDADDLATA
jgi:hypothetical protein